MRLESKLGKGLTKVFNSLDITLPENLSSEVKSLMAKETY